MTIMESYKNLLVKIVESSWDVNKVIKICNHKFWVWDANILGI